MKISQIYVSRSHNFVGHHGREAGTEPMVRVPSVRCVAGSGLEGDRYFDHEPDYKGQVTFFSLEVYDALCARLNVEGKSPSAFRRNIIVTGADLNALIGREFEVQGVRFLGTEEARPCYWMNQAFGSGALEALEGNGGLRARILTSGELREEEA